MIFSDSVKCTESSFKFAAENENLELVKWLYENSSNLGLNKYQAMTFAESHGKLNIVQWLYDNGSKLMDYAGLYGAVQNGHLDIVQWNFDKFDIDSELKNLLIEMAEKHKHGHIIDYLMK